MKKFIIFISILAILAAFALTACQQPEPATAVDISVVETIPVGQKAEAGDIVWEVVEVEDLGTGLSYDGGNTFLEPEEGKFIGVTFSVQNTGQEDRILYDLTVIDDKGRSYSICIPAYAFYGGEQACTLQEIIPGVDNTFTATFDVATDTEDLVLELTDLGIPPQNTVYVDLGI